MPSPLPSNTVIAALPNSARRSTSLPAEASDLRQLARLDQVNQHVPLVFLQDREVPGFTDADLVALDGDLRTVDARRAERHLQAVHFVSSLSSSGWREREETKWTAARRKGGDEMDGLKMSLCPSCIYRPSISSPPFLRAAGVFEE